jgi:hypothetical protein
MFLSQMTHVGRLPIRFNHNFTIVYFLDNATSVRLPYFSTPDIVEVAVKQYIHAMLDVYQHICNNYTVPPVGDKNVGAEYEAVKKAFDAVNNTP